MLHHSGRGVCMLLCLLWLTTWCHALSSGTVTHGLWRPDLQLPLLFVSGCLAYFHKDKHGHLFCFAFPWKWNKQVAGRGTVGAGFFVWCGEYITGERNFWTVIKKQWFLVNYKKQKHVNTLKNKPRISCLLNCKEWLIKLKLNKLKTLWKLLVKNTIC